MSNINEMNVGLKWYVAHTYSGYENKVKTSLEKVIENRGLGDLICDINIPVEIVIEQKGEEQKEVEVKLFPSYVYIKMVMNDETWHAVRNIQGVTGFVGGKRICGGREKFIQEQGIGTETLASSIQCFYWRHSQCNKVKKRNKIHIDRRGSETAFICR